MECIYFVLELNFFPHIVSAHFFFEVYSLFFVFHLSHHYGKRGCN